MEITWFGLSCFRLTERGLATVVTDPYDSQEVGYEPIKFRADIVSVSHDDPGHNYSKGVRGYKHLITGPCEFEIGEVFITGIQTNQAKKSNNKELRNTIYVFDYSGVTVAHLGNLDRVPSQTEVEALGTVNVALVPVGGSELTAAKAAEVVSLLEPGFVIPMYYATPGCKLNLGTLDKFLKEMGLDKVDVQPSLKLSQSSVPDETRVAVLEPEQ